MPAESENLAVRIHKLVQESIVEPDFGGYTKVWVKKVETSEGRLRLFFEVEIELFADKEPK